MNSRLKQTIGSLIASTAMAMAASSTMAQTNYTGIYQHTTLPNYYASVHHKGNQLTVALFTTMDITNSGISFWGYYGTVSPRQLNYWELMGGPISGTTATLSGEIDFGACFATYRIDLSASPTIRATVQSVNNTALGNQQRANCPAGYPIGSSVSLVKIF